MLKPIDHCFVIAFFRKMWPYIPPDIGACYKSPRMPTFEYTQNIAFFNAYNEMRKKSNHTGQFKKALEQITFNKHPLLHENKPCDPFPMYLNDSKVHKHIKTLKDLAQKYNVTDPPNLTSEKQVFDTMVEEFIEDYISEESSLSVTQTKWTIAGSIITTALLVVSVIWLTIKLKKLEKTGAALALTAQIPLIKSEELLTPNPFKVISQDTWLAILLALASVIGIIIYLIKSCKSLTLCRGHIFANTITIYVVICEEIR